MRWSGVSSPVEAVAPEFPMVLVPAVGVGCRGFAGLQAAVEGDCGGVVVGACLLTLKVGHLFRKKLLKIPLDIGVLLLAGAYIYQASYIRGTHLMSLRAELVILSSSLKRGVCALSPK
jgi:hypothetical protein